MEKTCLPLEHHRMLAKDCIPMLRRTDEPPEAHRARCTAKLRELLGMDSFVRCAPALTVTQDETANGVRRIHFTVETEPGYLAHADLLLPENQSGPLPLCCCLQAAVIPDGRSSVFLNNQHTRIPPHGTSYERR